MSRASMKRQFRGQFRLIVGNQSRLDRVWVVIGENQSGKMITIRGSYYKPDDRRRKTITNLFDFLFRLGIEASNGRDINLTTGDVKLQSTGKVKQFDCLLIELELPFERFHGTIKPLLNGIEPVIDQLSEQVYTVSLQ